jgi:O-antigen/teichoic acid export membrane protein
VEAVRENLTLASVNMQRLARWIDAARERLPFVNSIVASKLSRGVISVLVIQSFGALVSYITQISLARWMGASGYGIYTYVIGWAMTLSIVACFGMHQNALRYVPEYLAKGEWPQLKAILQLSFWLLLASASLLALLAGIVAWLFAAPTTKQSFVIAMFTVVAAAVARVQRDNLRALGKVSASVAVDLLLRPLFLLIAACLMVRAGRPLSVSLAISCNVLAFFLASVTLCIFVRSATPLIARKVSAARKNREWLQSAVSMAAGSALVVAGGEIDLLLSGYILGAQAIGPYQAARRTALFVTFAMLAANTAAAPVLSAFYAQRKHEALQHTLAELVHISFWPALLGGVVICFLGKMILGLFGTKFVLANDALIILMIGELIGIGYGSVGIVLQLTGFQQLNNYILGFATLLQLTLSLILIPIWRTEGAAIAVVIAQIATCFLRHRAVVRELGVHPSIFGAIFRTGMHLRHATPQMATPRSTRSASAAPDILHGN